MRRPGPFRLAVAAASAVLGAFLLLPVVALVWGTGVGAWVEGLYRPLVWPALRLSLFTTAVSLALTVLLGTPMAWGLSRLRGRLGRALEVAVTLPVVLPPAVAGLALLLTWGRRGVLGTALGFSPTLTTAAVVMAEVFVSAPFFLQGAAAAFRGIDEDLLAVARTLGARPARVFFRVAVPMVGPALVGAAALAWARALGEFGATLMFAGSLEGKTQTLPLAVYAAMGTDLPAARAISVVLVAVAFAVLLAVRWPAPVAPLPAKEERPVEPLHLPSGERAPPSVLEARVAMTLGALALDAQLSTGGALVLTGPNGAGKTSLLRALVGVLRPAVGRVTLGERVLFDAAAGVDVPPEERALAYVPQGSALFPHLSVRGNVDFAARSQRPRPDAAAREAAVARALSAWGLSGLADRAPAALSGGERQRAALARALVGQPQALLLDEPLASLDPTAREATRAALRAYLDATGMPAVLVTHDPLDAAALGDRVVRMEAGKLGGEAERPR